jgi:hypothetical protein
MIVELDREKIGFGLSRLIYKGSMLVPMMDVVR